MAIIYTYPTKATPVDADLILISDSADSNKTKQVTVASIKGQTAGVTSVAATLPLVASAATGDTTLSLSGLSALGTAGQVIKVNSGATALEFGTIGGGTFSVQDSGGTAIAGIDTLNFNTNLSVSHSSGSSTVTINASSGSSVDTFTNAFGTYITGTANSTATGAVDMGTIDLSATGTANNTTFLRGDNTWATPTSSGGISFSGTTANGIATYSNSTTANVSSVFTVSGNKLSAPAGSLADPSIEVGAIGGLYAASGGILLAHNGANAIGVTSSSIVNYKLTQFNAGLKFGATGETLSSYEEGTWTPVMFQSSSPSVTATGYYIKIGKKVTAFFTLVCTAGGSAEISNARISGLPFNAYSGNGYKAGVSIAQNTANASNQKYIAGEPGGATTLDLKVFTSGTDYQYAQGRWPNSQGNFTVSGSYTYHAQS